MTLSHHLPPFVGEAFGGSTSLVDVGVGRQSHDEAIGRPTESPSLPLMDLTVDAERATLLVDRRKHDAVVEDEELSDFEAKLGEGAEPVVKGAANCRSVFVQLPGPPLIDHIGSKEAHYRVDVTPVRSLEGKARKLNRVEGRGLFGHRRASIPPGEWDGPIPRRRSARCEGATPPAGVESSGLRWATRPQSAFLPTAKPFGQPVSNLSARW